MWKCPYIQYILLATVVRFSDNLHLNKLPKQIHCGIGSLPIDSSSQKLCELNILKPFGTKIVIPVIFKCLPCMELLKSTPRKIEITIGPSYTQYRKRGQHKDCSVLLSFSFRLFGGSSLSFLAHSIHVFLN